MQAHGECPLRAAGKSASHESKRSKRIPAVLDREGSRDRGGTWNRRMIDKSIQQVGSGK